MLIPRLCIGILLVCYTAASVNYAAAWQNGLTLWTHAVLRAPLKPRPWVNLSIALMERQRFPDAQAVLDHVDRDLLSDGHLPSWDVQDARRAIQTNRLVVARLANAGGPFSR